MTEFLSKVYSLSLRRRWPVRVPFFLLRATKLDCARRRHRGSIDFLFDLQKQGYRPSLREAVTLSELSQVRKFLHSQETIEALITAGEYQLGEIYWLRSVGPESFASPALRAKILQILSDAGISLSQLPRNIQSVLLFDSLANEKTLRSCTQKGTPQRPRLGEHPIVQNLSHALRAIFLPLFTLSSPSKLRSGLAVFSHGKVFFWLMSKSYPQTCEIYAGQDLLWSSALELEGPGYRASNVFGGIWLATGSHKLTPGGAHLLQQLTGRIRLILQDSSVEHAEKELILAITARTKNQKSSIGDEAKKITPRRTRPYNKKWMGPALDHYQASDQLFFDLFGTHLFGVGGTLLGAVREGGFISHDKDMDVAFLSSSTDPQQVRKEFVDRVCALLERGENLAFFSKRGNLYRRRQVKWWNKDKSAYLDLFPAYFNEHGHFCRPTFVCAPISREIFDPLVRLPFEDGYMWSPAQPHTKIRALTGESWRRPDPNWSKPKFEGSDTYLLPLRFTGPDYDRIQSLLPVPDAQKMAEARLRVGI